MFKDKKLFLKVAGMAAAISLASFIATSVAAVPKAAPKIPALGGIALATCYSGGSVIATSTTFTLNVSPVATSTMVCDIGGTDLYDINIFATGSSSASQIIWNNQYATDFPSAFFTRNNNNLSQVSNGVFNDVDWYQEDCLASVQDNSNRAHGAVCTNSLSLGTSPTLKNVSANTPAERYMRINMAANGATSTVNIRVVKRLVTK